MYIFTYPEDSYLRFLSQNTPLHEAFSLFWALGIWYTHSNSGCRCTQFSLKQVNLPAQVAWWESEAISELRAMRYGRRSNPNCCKVCSLYPVQGLGIQVVGDPCGSRAPCGECLGGSGVLIPWQLLLGGQLLVHHGERLHPARFASTASLTNPPLCYPPEVHFS